MGNEISNGIKDLTTFYVKTLKLNITFIYFFASTCFNKPVQ